LPVGVTGLGEKDCLSGIEVMMKDSTIQAFFALIRAGLWEKDVELRKYGSTDFDQIMHLAEEQSVVGLVTAGLEHVQDVKVPQEWILQFIGSTLQIEQQNKEMNEFIARLIEQLRKKEVYAILVKGQGIAQCYERPLWRASGDVDLFLSDTNYKKAKEILKPLASTVEEEYVREKHLCMTIDDWIVELHGRLYCGLSSRIEKELDDVLRDTFYGGAVRSWDNNGAQVFLLRAENDAFYVFTHILQHFYKEGVGLRQICDWCRLLFCYREKLDLRVLEARINRAGLMTAWRTFGVFVVEYLGMPMEAMPLLNEKDIHNKKLKSKAKRIRDYILSVGNMGHNRGSWLMEHDSWLSRQFVVRKAFSMFRRTGDMINHAWIFPKDSLRFFPRIMWNGMRSAVRGEG
jgi:hypothetical protein